MSWVISDICLQIAVGAAGEAEGRREVLLVKHGTLFPKSFMDVVQ